LEATQFGVPQKRKRILLIGWDTAKVTAFKPTAFWNRVDNIKEPLPQIRSFIQPSLDNAHPLTTATIPADFQRHALSVPLDTPVTGKPHPYVVLKADLGLLSCAKRDSPIHSEVMDLTAPSKTIICTYGHQPRLLVGLQRGSESFVRTLTPDELKQIQGFPADYKLLGTVSEQVIQVGNAVPPPMIKAIVEALPH
jgi:DNA (cytosine-5)-methyltransferase 1